jgi:hypothetical protein
MSNSALQLEEPEWISRRSAVVQRSGWSVLALIVLAALVGMIGPGPLSTATHTDPSGLVELRYERFTRHQGQSTLQLQVSPDPARPGTARIWLSGDYLAAVQVQQIWPQPETWTGTGTGTVLTFPVHGAGPVSVEVLLNPDQMGLVQGAVGAPGRQPVRFWQFVYP